MGKKFKKRERTLSCDYENYRLKMTVFPEN